MFDIDSLAKQVLCNEDFMPDSYATDDEVFEIRERKEEITPKSNGNNEIIEIIKSLSKKPQKQFRIGEIAQILDVKDSILRYWETKFPTHIKPTKNSGGQRLYKIKDIENFLKIKKFLYIDKLSIEGAKLSLNTKVDNTKLIQNVSCEVLGIIKEELEDLIAITNTQIESLQRLGNGK